MTVEPLNKYHQKRVFRFTRKEPPSDTPAGYVSLASLAPEIVKLRYGPDWAKLPSQGFHLGSGEMVVVYKDAPDPERAKEYFAKVIGEIVDRFANGDVIASFQAADGIRDLTSAYWLRYDGAQTVSVGRITSPHRSTDAPCFVTKETAQRIVAELGTGQKSRQKKHNGAGRPVTKKKAPEIVKSAFETWIKRQAGQGLARPYAIAAIKGMKPGERRKIVEDCAALLTRKKSIKDDDLPQKTRLDQLINNYVNVL